MYLLQLFFFLFIHIIGLFLLLVSPSCSFSCPLWQWSGAPQWTSACCWLTPSLRTWLPSAVRLDAQTVSFKLDAQI